MKKGFTLIELLVVIVIILILAALLFPVFTKAREKARQATCISNQKQIAAAVIMSIQDNQESLPGSATVWTQLALEPPLLVCPSAVNSGSANNYGFLFQFAGRAVGDFIAPNTVPITVDGTHVGVKTGETIDGVVYPITYSNLIYSEKDVSLRHNGKCVVSYLDGHVNGSNDMPTIFLNVKKDLSRWLTPASIQYDKDTNLVTSWKDGSGNAADFTVVNNLSYTPSITTLNHLPGIQFNGSGYLTCNGSLTDDQMTEFAVFSNVTSGGWSFLAGRYNNGNGSWFNTDLSGSSIGFNPARNSLNSKTITAGKPHLVMQSTKEVRRNSGSDNGAASATLTLDRDPLDNVTTTQFYGTGANSKFSIGADDIGNNKMINGYFCEYLYYKRVLTSEEMTSVLNYLRLKYSL